MPELESQIAKIQLGNTRQASSFVYVEAEKASGSNAELYLIVELPLLNPAASESCEKICLAMASALKRSYRQPLSPTSFETALGQINEELAKLASLGQVHWVNKLSSIIAVKEGASLHIATAGKVAAYLFRSGEFTDISCSAEQTHPIKAFENFATGKIRLDDLIILSTTQLFNYLAMDRLSQILQQNEFLPASQIIVQLLKDLAGPEAAFGSILNLQVQPGQAAEQEIDLEDFIVENEPGKQALGQKILETLKSVLAFSKQKRVPKISLPSFGTGGTGRIKDTALLAARKSSSAWQAASRKTLSALSGLRPQNFKTFSREKKFFLISLAVLAVAVIITIIVAAKIRTSQKASAAVQASLKQTQSLLNNAQTSLLYNDENAARDYFNQAQNKLPAKETITKDNLALYQDVSDEFNSLQAKILKQSEAKTDDLGLLAKAEFVINLPSAVAVQTPENNIVSFSKSSGKIEDGAMKAPSKFFGATPISQGKAAVLLENGLGLWDSSNGTVSGQFTSNVAAPNDFGGMAFYPDSSRVYIINKKLGQITSFIASNGTFTRPTVSVKDPGLDSAQSLAIDGNIYALNKTGISKYQKGAKTDFNMPSLPKAFSGSGKIYTQKDYKYLYLLDIGNNRILVLDKKGGLVLTLTSEKMTKAIDFAVDEPGKVIYVLNDTHLLKVSLP